MNEMRKQQFTEAHTWVRAELDRCVNFWLKNGMDPEFGGVYTSRLKVGEGAFLGIITQKLPYRGKAHVLESLDATVFINVHYDTAEIKENVSYHRGCCII